MAATNPRPDGIPEPRQPERRDVARERSVLTRKWSYLLLSTVFLPLRQDELDQELAGLFDEVCATVRAEPFDAEPARAVGARLVALGCTGDQPLSLTTEVLGKGLLSWWEFQPVQRFAERIVLTLGALSGGFVAANRDALLDQQELTSQALLKVIRDAQVHLRESEARFDEVASSSASGILIAGLDGRLTRVNAAIGDILGYSATELTGTSLFDLVLDSHVTTLREDFQKLVDGELSRVRAAQRLRCRNGDVARVSLTASLLHGSDERPSHFVTVIEDGTELLLLQNELHRQALHDRLTGLPNRQLFTTHVENALHRADPVHGVTLFQLDLDSFGVLCNGLGRSVGDSLLVEVKRRLGAVMAQENVVLARLGADEFGILVRNSADTPTVAILAGRINAELARATYSSAPGVAVSASIGVVHRPARQWDAAELLRAADMTLRRAKAAGRAQWLLFHPEQDARDQETARLVAGLPGAWADGELDVVYRPMINLADDRVAGVEALLRWRRPGSAPLSHDRCVELADRTGVPLAIGEWQLRELCRAAVTWWPGWARLRPVAAGLTAHQCADADLVSRVVGVLDAVGFPPDELLLWVPEGALSAPEVADNLKELAEVGVRIGLDGFGTAPDELVLLADLPVRCVRLSRRLVQRQALAGADSAISDALTALLPVVRRAGALSVVDAVRTREQAGWWRSAGADLATGDLFGTPRQPDELLDTDYGA